MGAPMTIACLGSARSCSIALCTALASACGDDADPQITDGGPSSSADDDESGGSPDTGADTGTGSGELGPTAQVRVVNLVEGMTFAAWGADSEFSPVVLHDGMTFETISDYFDAPLDQVMMHPQIVLLPAGETPDDVATWEIDNSLGPDRAFVTFTELDAADERATIIVTLDAFTGNLQYEQLDETELMLGDASMANLHVSWNLFDLAGGVVPAFAVAGQPCLFDGSTGVPQAWSVAPGTFDVAIYDRQTVSDCTEQLASTSITAAAGDEVLVAVYHVGDEVRFVSEAIPQ